MLQKKDSKHQVINSTLDEMEVIRAVIRDLGSVSTSSAC